MDSRTTSRHAPRRASSAVALWLVSYTLIVQLAGGTVPTPLFVVYEGQYDFGEVIVTLIFAAYGLGIVISLIGLGRLSDQVGRRPVLLIGVAVAVVSTALFLAAAGVGWLLAARLVSGLAVGLTTGTATSLLTELEPNGNAALAGTISSASIMGGLGLGPLISGVIAEYAPAPVFTPYLALLALLVLAAVAVRFVPDTVHGRWSDVSLRPQSLTVPASVRPAFSVAALAVFSAFALQGFVSSLSSSLLVAELHENSHVLAGLVVSTVFTFAAAVQVVLRKMPIQRAMRVGLSLLPVALASLVIALAVPSLGLFIIGAAVGGVGAGLAFMGSLALVNSVVPSDSRSQAITAYYVAAYMGLTLPVIGVGTLTQFFGAPIAALVFAIVIGALAVGSLTAQRRLGRSGNRGR